MLESHRMSARPYSVAKSSTTPGGRRTADRCHVRQRVLPRGEVLPDRQLGPGAEEALRERRRAKAQVEPAVGTEPVVEQERVGAQDEVEPRGEPDVRADAAAQPARDRARRPCRRGRPARARSIGSGSLARTRCRLRSRSRRPRWTAARQAARETPPAPGARSPARSRPARGRRRARRGARRRRGWSRGSALRARSVAHVARVSPGIRAIRGGAARRCPALVTSRHTR